MSDDGLTVRLEEKLFVKKFEDEDCISALACVDFCATCAAVDYSFAKEVMK